MEYGSVPILTDHKGGPLLGNVFKEEFCGTVES
jgi:hypothetical protein